jgi:hypothetical protein
VNAAPTNSFAFWKGGAPFGRPSNHSMYIPRLDSSCKFYFIGEMIYRWVAPEDIETDSVFRLILTTDTPPTTHLSGKLQLSHANAAPSSSMRVESLRFAEYSATDIAGAASAVVLSLLLTYWAAVRLRRRSHQIVLEYSDSGIVRIATDPL